MDKKAYALARKYTDDSIEGIGSVKGAPCTIKSITKDDGVSDVEFEWTGSSGTKMTQHMYVNDGENGIDGVDGKDGKDGVDGSDGFSPVATVETIEEGAQITITDATGTTSAIVENGPQGPQGPKGDKGDKGDPGSGGGTWNYEELHNLPTINGNEAIGELSDDIAAIIDPLSNEDVEDIKNVIDDDTNN